MKKVMLVPTEDLERAWPHVRDMLMKPLERAAEMDIEDVYGFIRDGIWQLCVAVTDGKVTCAGTTELVNYPLRRVLRLVLVGGEGFQSILDNFGPLEDFARYNNATGIETLCRKGLSKWYAERGYSHKYDVMVKDL